MEKPSGSPKKHAMVTIVIPHYQTHDIIRLCLRSIRKFTPQFYKVIVVDNDSKDESLEYLKSVKWLHLIQRKEVVKRGSWAHGSALDIGLTDTQTEFFLALHSDVMIKDSSWLSKLLTPFQKNPALACVGTGKLEDVPATHRVFKKMGDIKGLLRFLKTNLLHNPDQFLPEYIRTTCAVYRTEILKKEKLSSLPREEQKMTSGQALYYELVQRIPNPLSSSGRIKKSDRPRKPRHHDFKPCAGCTKKNNSQRHTKDQKTTERRMDKKSFGRFNLGSVKTW